MTAGTPWSVKGIDPKAREIAKDLAKRSGMTLGEWLNHMIVEGEAPDGGPSPGASDDEPLYLDVAERPVIETPRAGAPARYEAVHHPADEVGKVAEAIERLTARIEAAEQRSTLAITGIDQSVRGALGRLENAERDHIAVAARFEGAVDDLKTEQTRFAERMRRLEAEAVGPRSAEALRALEGSLGKVAGQVYEGDARTREALTAMEAKLAGLEAAGARGETPDAGALADEVAARVLSRLEAAETRTNEAIRDLGASFVKLDGRLRKVEGAGGGAAQLQTLAASLTNRIEAARREMAESLRQTSEGRFDRMERQLAQMAGHVQAAEQRSALAIERMGREVVGMADNLSRRVQAVEGRSAQAVEQVGSEVSRIAGLVEKRLAHTDGAQAQALERLGAEIARITERLSERIANSERRGAQAIDDVGEQLARVTERISQRQERVSTDLAERIRQSEERTARLLEEAREKIDASMTSATRRLADTVALAPQPAAAPAPAPRAPDPFLSDPFPTRGQAIPDEAFEPPAFAAPARFDPPPASPVVEDFPARGDEAAAFSAEDFDAADGFANLEPESAHDDYEAMPEPVFEAEPQRPLSTREVIEQARAAARVTGPAGEPKPAKAPRGGLFGKSKADKRRAGSTLQTALAITGVAAFLGVGAVGVVWLNAENGGGATVDRIAQSLTVQKQDEGEIQTAEADTAPSAEPRVSMALTTDGVADPAASETATAQTAPAATPSAPGAPTAVQLYEQGVARIEAKDSSGLEMLRKAANLGHPAAQFYLAKLYENGEGGVAKDLAQARRWTERAAQSGDRKAMHNLGLYYFEGTGGQRNLTTAAQWFRRAADQGLTDSQYNLGKLYEEGLGVTQNGAEAYKWYLIAGRNGDAEARASAERLKPGLSADARAGAERSASSYRAAAPKAQTQAQLAGAPGLNVSAQKALFRLGYYQGPQDGTASPALTGAIRAFQRDQGLPATGQLDRATQAKLAPHAQ
ncbi:MAG: peptidoglycan-binding protein [Caulobacter sp.]